MAQPTEEVIARLVAMLDENASILAEDATKKLRAEIRSLQKRLRDSERGNMRLSREAKVSYALGVERGKSLAGKPDAAV